LSCIEVKGEGGVWEGKLLEEQTPPLTRFGQIFMALMSSRGVSGLSELARLSKEAGYEADEITIRREMYTSSARRRIDPNTLDGPASVLGLSTQEQSLLVWAATFGVFASELGARRFEEFVEQKYGLAFRSVRV
jgi:hypothetical protein